MVDADLYQPLVILGLILIFLGVVFLAAPFLIRFLPSIERLPPIILWVYKSDGFYFATSPLLIIISIISIITYSLKTH